MCFCGSVGIWPGMLRLGTMRERTDPDAEFTPEQLETERKTLQLINTAIHLGCFKLIKGDSEDVYNVTKDLYFTLMLFF